MTSSRPYLLRAIYEWLVENQLTPYIMVDASFPGVEVPSRHVEDGKIVLNIESQAIQMLRMGNDAIEFDARFSGVSRHIFVPIRAIKAIYAFENGRGMVFGDDEEDMPPPDGSPTETNSTPTSTPPKKGRPDLKIIK